MFKMGEKNEEGILGAIDPFDTGDHEIDWS